jgi:hypothetical protein
MRIGWIGGFECVIILVLLVIVAALAFRIGATRDKRR